MDESLEGLRTLHRRVWVPGLVLCVLGPLVLLGLAGGGLIPPGANAATGLYQQAGYSFTGLVFLAAAWMSWRKRQVQKAFRAQPPGLRSRVMVRETLLFTALSGSSALWGTLYWIMVGWNAYQHVLTFILLTPAMFLLFVPRLDTWALALKEETP